MMSISGEIVGKQYERPIADAFERAQKSGLLAGAKIILNEVREALRPGYRSSLGNQGQFVTGESIKSEHLKITTPYHLGGRWRVSVGTDLAYNLYWEVGHHNIFTRHFERDEKWHPAFVRARARAQAAYERIVQQAMRGASGGGT